MKVPYIDDLIFEWDSNKDQINIEKHSICFKDAIQVFYDKKRLLFADISHSTSTEQRWYCVGKIGNDICTVRFVVRNNVLRIIGAGYWRKERKLYEKNTTK